MTDDRGDVIHLLRRTGYAARPADVDGALRAGYAATVDAIVAGLHAATPAADAVKVPTLSGFAPVSTDPTARRADQAQRQTEGRALVDWWMGRMVATEQPFAEKLTFFWHGHFATSIQKVRLASYMLAQNQLLRTKGAGAFEDLTQAMAKGSAMLIWLDANQNKKAHPNENFARELMELFTLGIGSYTEADVKDAARAFTGWTLDRQRDQFVLRPAQHDSDPKTVLGTTGDLGGEDVIHLCCSNAATARHVAARMWSRFAAPIGPDDPIAGDLATAWGPGRDTAAMVRAMLLHPTFRAPATKTGLVKQPVEWVVGALRALNVSYSAPIATATARTLQSLGQVPFDPPSVGGWPAQTAWLSTATELARLTYAQLLAGKADLTAVTAAAPADRPAAVAALLGVAAWSDQTRQALVAADGDARSLVTLALTAPELVLA